MQSGQQPFPELVTFVMLQTFSVASHAMQRRGAWRVSLMVPSMRASMRPSSSRFRKLPPDLARNSRQTPSPESTSRQSRDSERMRTSSTVMRTVDETPGRLAKGFAPAQGKAARRLLRRARRASRKAGVPRLDASIEIRLENRGGGRMGPAARSGGGVPERAPWAKFLPSSTHGCNRLFFSRS